MAINLQKGQVVHLKKPSPTKDLGEIVINLNWNQKPKGFWSSLNHFLHGLNDIDLDLCCLYELTNGYKSAIQALGREFGAYRSFPYIYLSGDDRTGKVATGENLKINGKMIYEIRKILVFADIYDGVSNWKEAEAVITVKSKKSEDIVIRPDSLNSGQKIFAIALIENVNNESFSIKKISQYYRDRQHLDKSFNWGLNWVAGRGKNRRRS